MKKIKISKKYLIREYSKKEKPIKQIAQESGCSVWVIFERLKEYNIPIRTKSEANKKWTNILTKKFLIREYVKKEKSPYRIAKETKTSPNTVRRYLKLYKIKIRTKSEAQTKALNHRYIDGRTNKIYYCKQKGCNNEIDFTTWKWGKGNCIDCGNKIMAKKAKGRKRPDLTKINKKRTGRNNPNYIEGLDREYPLEFNAELKLKIRKRDDYRCQLCGMTEEEHLIVLGQVLCVHHIDYIKENCLEINLTTLCNQCNLRVNYNRNYWTNYFQNKVKVNNDKI